MPRRVNGDCNMFFKSSLFFESTLDASTIDMYTQNIAFCYNLAIIARPGFVSFNSVQTAGRTDISTGCQVHVSFVICCSLLLFPSTSAEIMAS